MRVRNNPNANNELLSYDKYIDTADKLQEILSLKENKSKKVFLEIGMGKGDFISKLASLDKDNIYIGVEISKPVLAIATRKIQKFEKENDISLDNLYLMSFDAIKLSEVFKKGQVEKLYLNFSDPWPKKKHAKRRLTYSSFLEEYKKVLKKDGIIEFKPIVPDDYKSCHGR